MKSKDPTPYLARYSPKGSRHLVEPTWATHLLRTVIANSVAECILRAKPLLLYLTGIGRWKDLKTSRSCHRHSQGVDQNAIAVFAGCRTMWHSLLPFASLKLMMTKTETWNWKPKLHQVRSFTSLQMFHTCTHTHTLLLIHPDIPFTYLPTYQLMHLHIAYPCTYKPTYHVHAYILTYTQLPMRVHCTYRWTCGRRTADG